MKPFFLMTLLSAGIFSSAVDQLEFIDFILNQEEDTLVLSIQPSALISYKDIKNPEYSVAKEMLEFSLDAPVRQIAFMLRTLDNNRAVLMGKSSKNMDILSLTQNLRIRSISGETIIEKEYVVMIGLSKSGAYVSTGKTIFPIVPSLLTQKDAYLDFLKKVVFPFETFEFPVPKGDQFVIDLHYKWPKLLIHDKDKPIFDLFPSGILWNRGPIIKLEMFLGSAYAQRHSEKHWQLYSGSVLHLYAQAHQKFVEALKLGDCDEPTLEQIGLYEELLHRFPMNRNILKRLMEAYLYYEMEEEAASLISGMQPVFSTIKKGLEHQEELAERAVRKRNFLLGRKKFFKKNTRANIHILSPISDDLITGTSELKFSIEDKDSTVLSAYCFFDDALIGQIQKEPWKIKFTTESKRNDCPLKVVVYFENETYCETEIQIRTMKVDQEVSVHLVPLRVVVSKGGTGFMTDLKSGDFLIKENGRVVEIAHFSSERAPLRIAVLLDTSLSMTGEKLDRAQYALDRFVSHLQSEDRVSLYTFNHQVLRLNDYTNHFSELTPLIYNTNPQLSTALNDACLAGIQSLNAQSGTRILLILSDGTDSSSVSLDRHVIQALQNSDIMVYSIVLPGDWIGQSNMEGNLFLKDLAKLTGSVSTRLVRVKGIDEALRKMADEFRSYYYIAYYSPLPEGRSRELDLDVRGFRTKIRYRVLQQ
jgi:VWFA-related protein